jgi:hypothetical protein
MYCIYYIYAPLILSQLSIPTEGGRDGGDIFYSTIIRLKRKVEDRMEDRWLKKKIETVRREPALYTVKKKLFHIPVPSRDVTYQTLPRRE